MDLSLSLGQFLRSSMDINVILFLFWLIFSSRCFATANDWVAPTTFTPQNYPNPRIDIEHCGRNGKQSWTCDPNGVISAADADDLDHYITELKKHTGQCICGNRCPSWGDYAGYQASVAFVRRMPPSDDKMKAADDFAEFLREDWKLGKCDDDLVIFISKEDRQVYTSTGDQTAQILTDSCVNEIFNKLKNHFSAGSYAVGVREMLQEYTQALQKTHECNKPPSKTSAIIVTVIVALVLVGIVAFSFLRARCGLCDEAFKGSTTDGVPHINLDRRTQKSPSFSRKNSVSSASSASSGGGGGEF